VDYGTFLHRIGENLRRARWSAGLTQEDVAARGITYRYYQELERGQRNPTLRTLHQLARELGTTVAAVCNVEPAATSRAAERLADYRLKPPRRGRKPNRPPKRR
jgi:transcriptional regulator with XRE-family HTH domain